MTSPLKSLHEGTARRDLSHEPSTRGILRNKLQGIVLNLKFKLVRIRGTSRRDQSWSLRQDFEAKMVSSRDGTCPQSFLQGLVTGSSSLVCTGLN